MFTKEFLDDVQQTFKDYKKYTDCLNDPILFNACERNNCFCAQQAFSLVRMIYYQEKKTIETP